MIRRLLPALLLLALAAPAIAQPAPATGAPARPTFSPYLSLLNRGASPALNYFGYVRPQQQAIQQNAQLQQDLNNFNAQGQNDQLRQQQLAGGLIDLLLPPTGATAARFNSTGSYFNRVGGSGGFGTSMGGGRPGGASGPQPSFARPSAGGRNQAGGTGIGAGGIKR